MALFPAPLRTELNDVYPAPSNSVFKGGIGKLWDFITSLLGISGAQNDAITALRILDPRGVYNLSLVPSVAGNALTMNVKTRAGAAPSATDLVMVAQRNAVAGTGDFVLRTINAALALVISSGSTLGHVSGVQGTIYWYLLDNAGAEELAASSAYFGSTGIVSTTAEGGAGTANSATVMYSVAARASLPFRFVGRTLDTQAAAGTWLTLPSETVLNPDPPGNPAWVSSGGTADAITAIYTPKVPTLYDGLTLPFRSTAANATATPTFAPDGLPAHTLTQKGGIALPIGAISAALVECTVRYNLANTRWELITPAAFTIISNSLGADVLLNNTANYIDGPSAAQGNIGTWEATGTVCCLDTAGGAFFDAKLWDGTTLIASARAFTPSANATVPITLSGYLPTPPAGNIRISVKGESTVNGKILFNNSGNGKDSTITVKRVS